MNLASRRAERIAELHKEILHEAGRTLDKAAELGRMLLEIKDELPHGDFGTWLKNNVPFSQRSAARYMGLARRIALGKSATVSNLGRVLLAEGEDAPREAKRKLEANVPTGPAPESEQSGPWDPSDAIGEIRNKIRLFAKCWPALKERQRLAKALHEAISELSNEAGGKL